MKYLQQTTGYTLLHQKRKKEILEEFDVTTSEEKLCTCRHSWFQHVHRKEDCRLPKNF
jgi:hypothetical protein